MTTNIVLSLRLAARHTNLTTVISDSENSDEEDHLFILLNPICHFPAKKHSVDFPGADYATKIAS